MRYTNRHFTYLLTYLLTYLPNSYCRLHPQLLLPTIIQPERWCSFYCRPQKTMCCSKFANFCVEVPLRVTPSDNLTVSQRVEDRVDWRNAVFSACDKAVYRSGFRNKCMTGHGGIRSLNLVHRSQPCYQPNRCELQCLDFVLNASKSIR